jgi:hypothetical protein
VEDRWLYRWWRHTIDTNFEFKRRDGRLPVCTDRVCCSRPTSSGRGLKCLRHALPLP